MFESFNVPGLYIAVQVKGRGGEGRKQRDEKNRGGTDVEAN